jgi:ABC-2 type transport system permease protein
MGISRGDSGMDDAMSDVSSTVELLEQMLGLHFLPTVFAFFVPLFVSSEFHNGTMKNYVSKGFNRVQIYVSKAVVCCVAILVMYIVNLVITCIAGTIIWGFDPEGAAAVSDVAAMCLGVGLLFLAYASVFFLISMGLRNVGASIAANFGVLVLFPFLLMAVNYIVGDSIILENYWIPGNISALAAIPPENILRSVIVALCWLAGGTIIGIVLFTKQDIN